MPFLIDSAGALVQAAFDGVVSFLGWVWGGEGAAPSSSGGELGFIGFGRWSSVGAAVAGVIVSRRASRSINFGRGSGFIVVGCGSGFI